MKDPRLNKLADVLVNYSCKVKPGENVMLELTGNHYDFARAIVEAIYAAGGNPFVKLREAAVNRALLMNANENMLETWAKHDAAMMRDMQCYIGVRGGDNATETSDVPSANMQLYSNIYSQEVHMKIRLPQTRWVVLRYPSPSMAQQASMSTESFEDFYFNVCCLDYAKMGKAMEVLKALMEHTDKVRLTAQNTDISFSIKGIPVVPCPGDLNIPDGEVFTAPVKNSVNGRITFNTPSLNGGKRYENISFRFENGKIVEATANDTEALNKILDTDEGARYVGEFSLGVNPYINQPMMDTLFDEKISGSIHFTPGNAYDDAFNGNKSAIHWDLVLVQTPEFGGGDIYFDDVLIRHNGRFVLPELNCLNPENLV